MGQVLTWCFAAPVVLVFTSLLILFCMAVILRVMPRDVRSPAEAHDARSIQCPGCSEKIRFVVPAPPRIRCSCGNIMNKPDGGKASCPKCREVIHVTKTAETLRVKCPCGNVAEVAA